MTYDPVCEVCHMRPKMDRCGCCEECWYSGAYSRARAVRFSGPDATDRFLGRNCATVQVAPYHELCGQRHWNACPTLWGGERDA